MHQEKVSKDKSFLYEKQDKKGEINPKKRKRNEYEEGLEKEESKGFNYDEFDADSEESTLSFDNHGSPSVVKFSHTKSHLSFVLTNN